MTLTMPDHVLAKRRRRVVLTAVTIVLGVTILVSSILLIVFWNLHKSSHPVVDGFLRAMKSGDREALWNYVGPEFRAETNRVEFEELCQKMQAHVGLPKEWEARYSMQFRGGAEGTTGRRHYRVTFDRGSGELEIILFREDGDVPWRVVGFFFRKMKETGQ